MSIVTFPILQPSSKALPQTCVGNPNRCDGCRLKANGTCPGCAAVGGTKRCRMRSCDTQCGSCGGYKVLTPAICIKSPMKDMMLDKVETVNWDRIPKGRTLTLNNKAILVMNGGKRPMFRESIDSHRYDHIDAVGISLWRVWSSRGWFSADLKDYLGVPKRVKLFVSTSVFDDTLERATNLDVMPELMERQDVDVCMPLSYSTFADDSVMNQWFAWRRRCKAMEDVGGDFTLADRLSISIIKDVEEMVKRVPQVMFHTQGNTLEKADMVTHNRHWMRFLHEKLPKHVSFWFQGASSSGTIATFKRMFKGRDLYFLSSSPWMASHKGHEFTRYGKLVRSALPQDELTVRAFENFSALVNES